MRLVSPVQMFSGAKTVTLPTSYRSEASGSLHIPANLVGLSTHCENAAFLMVVTGCFVEFWASDSECADWLMWNVLFSSLFSEWFC